MVEVAGPFSGPFRDLGMSSCVFNFGEVTVSSRYVACADPAADHPQLTVAPLPLGGAARLVTYPGTLKSLKLAGNFIAAASTTNRPGTVYTVTNLRTRRRVLRTVVRGLTSYALGDDGTLVVAAAPHAGRPCASARQAAWYSPRAARAHSIGYSMCVRKLVLAGHKLIFQASARGSIAIERGDLTGSRPKVLTRYSTAGVLLDADAAHVLATDVNCAGHLGAFVAPGGPTPDPAPGCARPRGGA
jgi:hypothetical protein